MDSRALMLTDEHAMSVEKLQVPDDPPAGGAIIRVLANGICGADWDLYDGSLQRMIPTLRLPLVPGHEVVGEIAVIDPAAARSWGVAEGDKVAVETTVRCGQCHFCLSGYANRCVDKMIYGLTPADVGSGLWGGMAEYMVLRSGTSVFRIPEGMSDEDAGLFNPLGNSFHWTIEVGGARAGHRVLVLGSGQRGLGSCVAASEVGAAQVIMTGRRNPHKLALGREFGATDVINVQEQDTVAAVMELTGGLGVDVVVDTTPGDNAPILHALDVLAPGGKIVLVGVKNEPLSGLATEKLMAKKASLVGAAATTPWSVMNALRVISEGRYPFHKLHSHSVSLDETEHAIRILGGQIEGEQAIHITVHPHRPAVTA